VPKRRNLRKLAIAHPRPTEQMLLRDQYCAVASRLRQY
jgi:hypothetical protein